jgi:hypothetical protein
MKKRKANPREERTHSTTLLHSSNSSVSHMFRDLQQQYASVPSNVDLKHNSAPQYSSEKTRYLQAPLFKENLNQENPSIHQMTLHLFFKLFTCVSITILYLLMLPLELLSDWTESQKRL